MSLNDQQVRELAQKFHTPLYVFEEDILRRQCQALKRSISYPNKIIRYACKALTIGAILKIIRSEGLQLDAVSLNEVKRAMLAGFLHSEILYTGEGSSALIYEELLRNQILINCSSLDQLQLLGSLKSGAPCSVRINPGEGHGANNKVNTGGPASKHGIYLDQLDKIQAVIKSYNLKLIGIHSHIGSGADLDHWLKIKDLTFSIAKKFPDLEFVNLGGGLPVIYNPLTDKAMPLEEWGSKLSASFEAFSREYGRAIQLQIEPGRFIAAECGHLIAEVQTIKHTPTYEFVIVNTGLNHNPRPAMYGSFHPIKFVQKQDRPIGASKSYVVAGYLCESGDVFTVKENGELAPRDFPVVALGDYMLMDNIGAYSHSMKMEYNSMNLPASVLIGSDGSLRVIERRGTLEDLLLRETSVY